MERLQPAWRLACTETSIARNAGAAAGAEFDEGAAMGAVFGLFGVYARFALALATDAALDAGQGFDALRVDWLAAHFAEDGGLPVALLPVAIVVLRCVVVRGAEPLHFAEWAGHSRGGLREEHANEVVVWVGIAAEQADDLQACDGILAAADGPPAAVATGEFAGKHGVAPAGIVDQKWVARP
jgi:hypothetical protein